eukprot:Clim_evm68s11 gene=Clim_evmTU68s11
MPVPIVAQVDTDVEEITRAAESIDHGLKVDDHHPDLYDNLLSSRATASGGVDNYDSLQQRHFRQVFRVRSFSEVPSAIREQYGDLKCKSYAGIFPDVGRAWLTIDNVIYLWRYGNVSDSSSSGAEDQGYLQGGGGFGGGVSLNASVRSRSSSSFQAYTQLNQIIVSAGLVKPKANIFNEDLVSHLLVLCTPTEVVLVCVGVPDLTKAYANSGEDMSAIAQSANRDTPGDGAINGFGGANQNSISEDLTFYPGTLAVQTDNVSMYCVAATPRGCIFLGGADGYLYEVTYSAERSWFGNRCKLVRHYNGLLSRLTPLLVNLSSRDPIVQIEVDKGRNLLYTLSENSVISLFDLGEKGEELTFITSRSNLKKDIQKDVSFSDSYQVSHFQIVAIHAVEWDESVNLNLVAVTSTGIRLYFSVAPYFYPSDQLQGYLRLTPKYLELQHVRLPPQALAVHGTSSATVQNAQQQEVMQLQQQAFAPSPLGAASPFFPRGNTGGQGSDEFGGGFNTPANPNNQAGRQMFQNTLMAQTDQNNLRDITNVLSTFYSRGVLLLSDVVATAGLEKDRIVCIGTDNTKVSQNLDVATRKNPFYPLHETTDVLGVEGKTYCMAEAILPTTMPSRVIAQSYPSVYNEQATQHILPRRRFLRVNNQGVQIIEKLRPIDELQELLEASGGRVEGIAERFSQIYGAEMTGATVLAMLCMNRSSNAATNMPLISQQVKQWALQLFSALGKGPQMIPVHQQPGFDPNQAHQQQQQQQSSVPQGQSNQQFPPQPVQTASLDTFHDRDVHFSSQYVAMCIYVSRLLRPLWRHPIVIKVANAEVEGGIEYVSRLSRNDLQWMMAQMTTFLSFLDSYNVQDHRPTVAYTNAKAEYNFEAYDRERIRTQMLRTLTERIVQALSLLDQICDRMPQIVQNIHPQWRDGLTDNTFALLVVHTEAQQMWTMLVKAALRINVADPEEVKQLITIFRRRCPQFYSTDSDELFEADQKISLAQEEADVGRRRRLLSEVAGHYMRISPNEEDLRAVSEVFKALDYPEGVVDIALKYAHEVDPNGAGMHYLRSGQPSNDIVGITAYQNRCRFYEHIFQLLQSNQLQVAPANGSADAGATGDLTVDNAHSGSKNARQRVMDAIVAHQDELFHLMLYRFLKDEGYTEDLETIQSPFFEQLLREEAESAGVEDVDRERALDGLQRYYIRQKRFFDAAQILRRLAEMPNRAIDLPKRINYLSSAVVCARSAHHQVSSSTDGGASVGHQATAASELMFELEEKLEVAEGVQMMILQSLSDMLRSDAQNNHDLFPAASRERIENACEELNSRLINISDLYASFAWENKLYDAQLRIIAICGTFEYRDEVQNLWRNIIDDALVVLGTDGEALDAQAAEELQRVLVEKGRTYARYENAFPVPWLVEYLENLASRHGLGEDWTYRTLEHSGVALGILYQAYFDLFQRTAADSDNERKWHLVDTLCEILSPTTGLLSELSQGLARGLYDESIAYLPQMEQNILFMQQTLYTLDPQGAQPTSRKLRDIMEALKSLQARST